MAGLSHEINFLLARGSNKIQECPRFREDNRGRCRISTSIPFARYLHDGVTLDKLGGQSELLIREERGALCNSY